MKILAIADKHHKITNINSFIKENKIELIVLLGDLKYIDLLSIFNDQVPLIGVYGNHCSFAYFPELNAIDMHLKHWKMNNISFFGFEGCPYYKDSKGHEFSQDECYRLMKDAKYADIFLTHSPATGINSTETVPHNGFEAFTSYLDKVKPKFHFHGHSYPNDEQHISLYHETIVVYVRGSKIIDTDELEANKLNLPLAKPY